MREFQQRGARMRFDSAWHKIEHVPNIKCEFNKTLP